MQLKYASVRVVLKERTLEHQNQKQLANVLLHPTFRVDLLLSYSCHVHTMCTLSFTVTRIQQFVFHAMLAYGLALLLYITLISCLIFTIFFYYEQLCPLHCLTIACNYTTVNALLLEISINTNM